MHRDRAIREEDVVATAEGHAVDLADQPRREAGAIDEQVPRDAAAIRQRERGDVAIVGHHDIGHVADDMFDAELTDRVFAQQRREFRGVEVIGVIGDPGELGRGDRLGGESGVAQGLLEIGPVGEIAVRRGVERLLPIRRQVDFRCPRGRVERVIISVARRPVLPPDEASALFERGVAGAEEFGLADADLGERVAHRRPGSLTHTDRRDGGRFDQFDDDVVRPARAFGGESVRGDPAGGPAADDHDGTNQARTTVLLLLLLHALSLTRLIAQMIDCE